MPRFTVKEMLIATTLIAFGVGGLLIPYHYGPAILHVGIVASAFTKVLFFSAGPMIGAGLFTQFNKPWTGACVGFILHWLIGFTFFHPSVQ